MYKMISVLEILVVAFTLCVSTSPLSTMATFNVKYTVDHETKRINVNSVLDAPVSIHVIPPNSDTNGDEKLTLLHQFPGVATNVIFPSITKDDDLYVQLNNGVLYKTRATRVYTNFHTHKNRMVYGQLYTIAVDDFEIANKIYIGAPIYRNKQLVSVITCRFDDYEAGLVMYPVTGIRPQGLISGQIQYDDRVGVETLRPSMSVYGRQQLPYKSAHMSVKQFAMTADMNRQLYRDLPRSVMLFHNNKEITITVVEGEFEMYRIRLDGPLVTNQESSNEEK
ncbi:p26b [Spodoptera frugiperda multiple nucleopolyhedrovirus]|uniref:p26 protein n=1 Tax=Spodoptera frugiperda nuclear polyhedrosis virus TaxID=10455 RepID=A1YJC1_NPVSF|nr:p26b [Spodoptera frugiperda multiple nucleopolyhedrovirus]ABM45841.1 p26b [Spodoptera frugiperda multiple nucleopolyhedrovirus]AFH59074.1 p26b [Spodoptera frugiperda multiple nucleopolyhedrovirus]AIW01542.1 P26 protein [Spodoptera frugiperda multiple nucleopolyhedrovirus]QED40044.1 P26B [Spodoptera frugiperda multiple nucleopolyhedrovirus]QED40330.1 P26B [Spodoptera frugiperda multiple nucleopolyhedrovirus]